MSHPPTRADDRLAELARQADADRAALAKRLEPITKLERGLERLRAWKLDIPAAGLGTGLALSALLLALPAGRSPIVRGGIALLQLATSVRKLFARTTSSS